MFYIFLTKEFTFKNTILDLDDGSKNGRVEWVNIKYHSVYDPEQAFEMIIEWMVATGNSIAEIVMGWSRKTATTGLHLGKYFCLISQNIFNFC